ncbi:hypothetical protein JTB14_019285 [Gonioctena quinquepunctata]|nr:hypothetical protein JTB14_019285 [Gonioctena quinquepunctata]
MQEEDLAPTDNFLRTLGVFLKEKGQHVPFIIPDEHQQEPVGAVVTDLSPQTMFRQKLKTGKLDEALEVKDKTREPMSIVDLSSLIEKLLQSGRVRDAAKVSMEIIDRGNLPVNRVFRYLLNKLAGIGDVHTLENIGSKINSEVKRIVSFDNRLCHANLVAGKADEYLQKLNNDIESATEENLVSLGEQFPRGGAYGILEKNPDLTDQCK